MFVLDRRAVGGGREEGSAVTDGSGNQGNERSFRWPALQPWIDLLKENPGCVPLGIVCALFAFPFVSDCADGCWETESERVEAERLERERVEEDRRETLAYLTRLDRQTAAHEDAVQRANLLLVKLYGVEGGAALVLLTRPGFAYPADHDESSRCPTTVGRKGSGEATAASFDQVVAIVRCVLRYRVEQRRLGLKLGLPESLMPFPVPELLVRAVSDADGSVSEWLPF